MKHGPRTFAAALILLGGCGSDGGDDAAAGGGASTGTRLAVVAATPEVADPVRTMFARILAAQGG